MKFIDLFAGCGGLSLGLMSSGMKGVFAIEKTEAAFETLNTNLNNKSLRYSYSWPEWLPLKAMTTAELLEEYPEYLEMLSGEIDLIAGGPPCQGFSFAGLRNPKDARNRLTDEYINIVEKVKPKFLLLENVRGFQTAFKNEGPVDRRAYSEYVKEKLRGLNPGYCIFSKVIFASKFSVPQKRPRFIMIGIRKDVAEVLSLESKNEESFFQDLFDEADRFREENGLNTIVTVKDAIGDLEIKGKKLIECIDSNGFRQIKYVKPTQMNSYLRLMRRDVDPEYSPNSLRLPNHRYETVEKFKFLLKKVQKGHSIPPSIKDEIKSKKQCFTILDPDALSTTITTLPDDCMHYDEPRILSVRENARIQSFPDWFAFTGKYTTGGERRKKECPRYTQVGNAVPPLMAEIIGRFLIQLNLDYERKI